MKVERTKIAPGKEFLENREFSIISQTASYNIVHTAIYFIKAL